MMVAERDLNPNDKALAKAMQKRIGAAMRNLCERHLAQSVQGVGQMQVWSLVKG